MEARLNLRAHVGGDRVEPAFVLIKVDGVIGGFLFIEGDAVEPRLGGAFVPREPTTVIEDNG